MRAAYDQYSSYRPQASVRSRALAVGMALGVTILIVLALIQVGALGPHVKEVVPRLITIPLQPPPPARAKSENRLDHSRRAAITPPRPAKLPPLNMVILTPKDYAASDIATLPRYQRTAKPSEAEIASAQPDERVTPLTWVRLPTVAELKPYMPTIMPPTGSWGLIQCRMAEKYHVEDCREVEEHPAGSGLSRMMRQASWQFLLWPPTINGRPRIGEHVWVRFDLTDIDPP